MDFGIITSFYHSIFIGLLIETTYLPAIAGHAFSKRIFTISYEKCGIIFLC